MVVSGLERSDPGRELAVAMSVAIVPARLGFAASSSAFFRALEAKKG